MKLRVGLLDLGGATHGDSTHPNRPPRPTRPSRVLADGARDREGLQMNDAEVLKRLGYKPSPAMLSAVNLSAQLVEDKANLAELQARAEAAANRLSQDERDLLLTLDTATKGRQG